MLQKRLNAVMVLHVHKERTDSLSVVDLGNELVMNIECRCSVPFLRRIYRILHIAHIITVTLKIKNNG